MSSKPVVITVGKSSDVSHDEEREKETSKNDVITSYTSILNDRSLRYKESGGT